jgi:hypothetical protein
VQQNPHRKIPLRTGYISSHLGTAQNSQAVPTASRDPPVPVAAFYNLFMACWSVYRPKENLEVHRCSKLHTVQFPSALAIFLVTSAQPKISRQFPRLPGTPCIGGSILRFYHGLLVGLPPHINHEVNRCSRVHTSKLPFTQATLPSICGHPYSTVAARDPPAPVAAFCDFWMACWLIYRP